VTCVSSEFTGKNRLQRERIVYKSLWEEIKRDVNAVDTIFSITAEEAAARNLNMK
jgi:acid stress-induced BolA-like protein IbaG/YrbA